jgi:hypothetical protein
VSCTFFTDTYQCHTRTYFHFLSQHYSCKLVQDRDSSWAFCTCVASIMFIRKDVIVLHVYAVYTL